MIINNSTTTTTTIKLWKDTAKTKSGVNSFNIDTDKLWNNCTEAIKTAKTIGLAKSEVKKHCKSLEL